MDNQNNIHDELKKLNSSLPVGDSPNPFSVPGGYFDGLAERILANVKEQNQSAADELQSLSPLLASFPKKLPYSVPEGYFDENAANLSFLLKEEASPVLAAVGKRLPYEVPEKYFEALPQQVMARLVHSQVKVVPFFSRTWARAAVAAIVAGVVLVGGLRLLNNKPESPSVATAQHPADTPGNKAASGGSMSQYIQNISTEELDAFMNTVPVNLARMQRAILAPTEKKEIRNWLKDVPEKEVEAFLNDFRADDENLLVID
jgi:hypothetical protein